MPKKLVSILLFVLIACVAIFGLCACGSNDGPEITVSVTIDGSEAGQGTMFSNDVSIDEGGSVYDALVATGVEFSGSSNYVKSIGGLAEFDCGKTSGWTYSVNGDKPMKACGKVELASGDSVVWLYVADEKSL